MTQQHQQIKFEVNQVTKALSGASPLQASRILIDMELYEQQDSLAVLNDIYQEFESKSNLMEELVTPLALSVLDGVISHKDLKLNRTGVSASRVWQEIQGFDYGDNIHVVDTTVSKKQQLEAMRQPREYSKEVRKTMSKRKHLEQNKDRHFKGNTQAYSSIEYNEDGSRITVYRKQAVAENKGHKWKASDTDHVIPVKQINDYYANNALLTESDLMAITDGDHNFIEISNSFNRAKGAKNFSDMQQQKQSLESKQARGEKLSREEKTQLKKLSRHSDKSIEEGVQKQKESEQAILNKAREKALHNVKEQKWQVAKKAGGQAAEQTGYQALGHAIILFIKPLLFEVTDAIQNGFSEGVGKASTLDGLKFRFTRVMAYLKRQVLPMLLQGAKDFLQNFAKVMIEAVADLVTGMFKSVMKVISEGFSALIGAAKILSSSREQMSRAQKADAIVKLFAATAVTFAVFTFENTLLKGPLAAMPDFVKEIALTTLSGVASTIVVYLLDKADIFSTKMELRSKRVAEVFEYRVEQIKINTDAFSAESVRKLAEDKLRFKAIDEQMQQAIDADKDVNPAVYALADQFKIDLQIKSTDDFLHLLESSDALVV
ncbi:hypothetical protein [Ferrimonas sp. SCSIO 43195]|uniref:hypothetical protein n=1 Tax=Ferrimonas sp. SCSIO 43195 TaxID=2822844 RepID=UPI0020759729|nr:hypothetical protein [Ferrimonas sp. SCSIO 43195]USD39148.1 hypothetical protein J8Z22_08640 [Ferrimonas sp. SCSIO 43195]